MADWRALVEAYGLVKGALPDRNYTQAIPLSSIEGHEGDNATNETTQDGEGAISGPKQQSPIVRNINEDLALESQDSIPAKAAGGGTFSHYVVASTCETTDYTNASELTRAIEKDSEGEGASNPTGANAETSSSEGESSQEAEVLIRPVTEFCRDASSEEDSVTNAAVVTQSVTPE